MYIEEIEFTPLIWNFTGTDGIWDHIWFLVPKDTFEKGGNNGSYALSEMPGWVLLLLHQGCWFDNTENLNNLYQVVHHSTSCLECGGECDRMAILPLLHEAATHIANNLIKKKGSLKCAICSNRIDDALYRKGFCDGCRSTIEIYERIKKTD